MAPRILYMDGFEFLAALRADASVADIPVIIISSHDDWEERGRDCRANAHLTKPIHLDGLLSAVARQLRKRQGQHELGATPLALATTDKRAAMHLGKPPRQCEADAQAILAGAAGTAAAAEHLEDMLDRGGIDAASRVPY